MIMFFPLNLIIGKFTLILKIKTQNRFCRLQICYVVPLQVRWKDNVCSRGVLLLCIGSRELILYTVPHETFVRKINGKNKIIWITRLPNTLRTKKYHIRVYNVCIQTFGSNVDVHMMLSLVKKTQSGKKKDKKCNRTYYISILFILLYYKNYYYINIIKFSHIYQNFISTKLICILLLFYITMYYIIINIYNYQLYKRQKKKIRRTQDLEYVLLLWIQYYYYYYWDMTYTIYYNVIVSNPYTKYNNSMYAYVARYYYYYVNMS